MLLNIYGYFESKCFGQNASLLKLEEKSKLNHSFCITFIGLSFSCFDARSNFWQGCSLKRSLVKTFTLKYCNVYGFNQHLHSQYQVLWETMPLSGGICRLAVIVCCPNQCS